MTLMERRRALMAVKKGGGLPSIYQQVEWIESSGTQAIITPCWLKQESEVFCEFMYTSVSASGYLPTFGCMAPSLSFSNSNDIAAWTYCSFGNQSDKVVNTQNSYFKDGNFHTVQMNKSFTRFDDLYSVSYNASVTENSGRKIALFCRMDSSNTLGRFAYRRIKQFRITESGTVVIDLVPCYRKADGEIGMYDLVSKAFLTNAGTGNFTKGADVK